MNFSLFYYYNLDTVVRRICYFLSASAFFQFFSLCNLLQISFSSLSLFSLILSSFLLYCTWIWFDPLISFFHLPTLPRTSFLSHIRVPFSFAFLLLISFITIVFYHVYRVYREGWIPRSLRALLDGAVQFVAYELTQNLLNKHF